jgi:hypothetical protein
MCDYSLEQARNRKAIAGEDLIVRQFMFSRGFTPTEEADCAVCCEPGMTMTLWLFGEPIEVVFAQRESKLHRDGVTTPDGTFMLLQNLPVGTRARVERALPEGLVEAAKGERAFEPEVRVAEPTRSDAELAV